MMSKHMYLHTRTMSHMQATLWVVIGLVYSFILSHWQLINEKPNYLVRNPQRSQTMSAADKLNFEGDAIYVYYNNTTN